MIPVKPQLSKSTCHVCLIDTSSKCCFFYSHSKKHNINANILNHLKTHPDKICYNCIEKIMTNECEYFKCPFCRGKISTDYVIIEIKQTGYIDFFPKKCNFETKNIICFGLIILLMLLWFFLGLITCWLSTDTNSFEINPYCLFIGFTSFPIPLLFYHNRKKVTWCKNCGFSIYVGLVFGFAIAIRERYEFQEVYLFYTFMISFVTFLSLLLCTEL